MADDAAARSVYEQLRTEGGQLLRMWVQIQQPKTVIVDFKRVPADFPKLEAQLSKLISAFANSAGGVIVWGLAESRVGGVDVATDIVGIPNPVEFRRWLQAHIPNAVQPAALTETVQIMDDPVVLVTFTAASDQGPHQAASTSVKTYYTRLGGHCQVMEHHMVATLFGQRARPSLIPILTASSGDGMQLMQAVDLPHGRPRSPAAEGERTAMQGEQEAGAIVDAVIEISSGSQNKYGLDSATGRIRLDRVLYSPIHYPAEYGFVPHTLAQDGDPLDIIVMISQPTFAGCQLRARVIGLWEGQDEHGVDDKLFGVAADDPRYDGVQTLEHLPAHTLEEVVHFFASCTALQGFNMSVGAWRDQAHAVAVLAQCRERQRRRQ